MGKSISNAMTYEGMSFNKPLPKGSVKKMVKQRNISEMDTFQILSHLLGRHYKFLLFNTSLCLNILWFVTYFKIIK